MPAIQEKPLQGIVFDSDATTAILNEILRIDKSVLLIEGPVAAGKSTFARHLGGVVLPEVVGINPSIIETDWFLHSKSHREGLSPDYFHDLQHWFRHGDIERVLDRIVHGFRDPMEDMNVFGIYQRGTGMVDNSVGMPIDLTTGVVIVEGFFAITPQIITLLQNEGIEPLTIVVYAPSTLRTQRREERAKRPGYSPLGGQIPLDQLMEKVYNPSWERHLAEIEPLIRFRV